MKHSTFTVTLSLLLGSFVLSPDAGAAIDTLVPTNSVWKYLDDGSDQGTNWITPSFSDAAWKSGPAELGYGDAPGRPEATVVEDNPTPGYNSADTDRFITTYFRHTFNVAAPGSYSVAQLRVLRDDGVVVYLNGREIFRSNMPGGLITSTTPGINASDDGTVFFSTNVPPSFLLSGPNVIAAEIHQERPNSSDISFDLELTGNTQNNPPVISILSPGDGAFYTAPATVAIATSASDTENNITLVEFFQGPTKLGEDASSPYTFDWNNVPLGNYALRAIATDAVGAKGTSAVVNVTVGISTPPTVANKFPAPGGITSLSNITVVFSESVSGVDASDLLVNGVPAVSVSGSGTTYTFTVPQLSEGTLFVGWNGAHGIVDFENPPKPLDSSAAGASWQYTLTDTIAPTITSLSPAANAFVRELNSIEITFSEPVYGLNAADLRINGVAATSLSGTDAGPYRFNFATPANGTVNFSWVAGHGITDRSTARNAFVGGTWSYNLNTNLVWEGQVVINEIMFHPSSEQIADEWIELRNRSGAAVNLAGWRLNRAIEFTFPNVSIPAGGYLVVAANLPAFNAKYPGVNAIGGWTGRLSNSRDEIELEDASGDQVDLVEYADEGDWATRMWIGGIGWEWVSAADGIGGRSLELRQAALDNNSGQNWQPSAIDQGTPGVANSVAVANLPPMILNVSHLPAIPRSTNAITVLARIVDESSSGITVRLWYRDGTTLPSFVSATMLDNGLRNDGVAGDGLYGVVLPPMANQTITEFYVEAIDAASNTRTWPAAVDVGGGSFAQEANAFFQVSDENYTGKQPVYRLIMRATDRNDFFGNFDRVQRNASFITVEGNDVQIRHNCYTRRRGASSFSSTPPTMKLGIPTDRMWNDKSSLNLNSVAPHAQVLGSAIALKAGLPAPYTRAVQLRFNGVNEMGGFGSYAHVEAFNSEWARDHYPNDSNGNAYSKRRPTCNFEYLGANPQSYVNCAYEKESNSSENDWADLIGLFTALDPDTTSANDYAAAVRRNVNVEQWMRYFAVLFLLNYTETSLANGVDDDFDLYRGIVDPRFLLLPHDFDQIYGSSPGEPTTPNNIFLAAALPNVSRFLHHPNFEPLFYEEYRQQLAGMFSTNQLFPLMDQVLGDWVSGTTIQNMKNDALNRINYVASALPATPVVVRATVTGEPDSPTYLNTATLNVSGTDITHYRYRLNNGAWSADRLVSQPITLSGLANGYYTVYVVGRNSAGTWQADADATISKTWAVLSGLRGVVINEVLARNDGVLVHEGTTPDYIELFNSSAISIDLSGLRLTDDLDDPNKFTFPANTTLAAGAYRLLFANDPDGTSGLHIGFGLGQNGDQLYLLDRATTGPRIIDSVKFGWQLSNLSISRLPNGQWGLSVPTADSANTASPVGSTTALKINEWLASPASPFVSDFIELYNPTSLPVDLGGLYLTDQPIGLPFRDKVSPLSFIDGFGYRAFIADGDKSAGPDHLDFSLSAETGEIALRSSSGALIDCVFYGQQFAGISQGRSPNGGSRIVYFDTPTPGAGNPTAPAPEEPQTIVLVPFNASWKYEESGVYPGANWPSTSFVDASWPIGQAALGFDANLTPLEPIRTPLTVAPEKVSYYFRIHFNLPAGLNPSSLRAVHLTDDGAVYYINGAEAGRFNMPAAPAIIGHDTPASANGEANSFQTTTLDQSNLTTGDNVLAVEVHQSLQRTDIFFALRLEALVITNNPAAAGLKINEVMANASSSTNSDGTVSDWVELYNPSNAQIDLAGMSFTDQLETPRRWIFPPGSVIAANGYRAVRFDSGLPATTNFAVVLNTGFGLKASGDSVYLFNRPQTGGELLDSVSFGLQAADWTIGRVPNGSSNWVLNLPTQNSLNIAASLGNPYSLKVNEWMAAPASGDDWFEIYNPSAQPVELSGLHLTDDLIDRLKYAPLPPRSYISAGLAGFLRIIADDNATAGNDHVAFALSRTMDSLGIVDRFGTLIDSYTFTNQLTGVSQGRLPDGSANIISFPLTPTPQESNYLPIPNVVINEVLTHTDLPREDAIELRNTSASIVNIGGWYLSDARDALRKYRIPTNTTIPANGFKVFYEYQFNPIPGDPTSFSLSSARGDQVHLSATDAQGQFTGFRTAVDFGPAANAVSFGRYITSPLNGNKVEFVAMSQHTFGADNPPSVDDFRAGTGLPNAAPRVGPVVVSEFMYHPVDLAGGVDNIAEEYIELRNITGSPVALYDPIVPANVWKLRDAVSFNFPPNTSLPANGVLLVVSFSPADTAALNAFRTKYGIQSGAIILGPYLGSLANGSDSIELVRPDSPQTSGPDAGLVPFILVDKVKYLDVGPWPTAADGTGQALHRTTLANFGNDPVNWTAAAPTPGPQGANPDADGDGMDDSWEQTYFGSTARNGTGDFDSDGMTDLNEFLAGTLPNNASSLLRLTVTDMSPTILTFTASAGKAYAIDYKTSLSITSWTLLQSIPAGAGGTVNVTDITPPGTRFYRVRLQ